MGRISVSPVFSSSLTPILQKQYLCSWEFNRSSDGIEYPYISHFQMKKEIGEHIIVPGSQIIKISQVPIPSSAPEISMQDRQHGLLNN
jgi:hypothetical protein